MNSHQRRVMRRASERAVASLVSRGGPITDWPVTIIHDELIVFAPSTSAQILADLQAGMKLYGAGAYEAFLRMIEPEIATGAQMDELCKIPYRLEPIAATCAHGKPWDVDCDECGI